MTAESNERDTSPDGQGLSILVVDDNVDSADALGELLSISGHRVATAYDGESAVEKAKGQRPDVVLLDLGLPRKDGFQVASELRDELGDDVCLVAVTGYGDSAIKERIKSSGFDHHLLKPITFDSLDAILDGRCRDGS